MIFSPSCFLNSDIISLLAEVVKSEKGLADPGSLRSEDFSAKRKGQENSINSYPLDIFP